MSSPNSFKNRLHKQFSNFNFQPSIQHGFTFMEIVIVVAIIVILATGVIMLVNPQEQIKKANDAKRKALLSQIARALELYYQDHGSYPPRDASCQIVDVSSIPWGNTWSPYMFPVPKDPTSPTNTFAYKSSGQTYYLYANLERGTKDSQVCNGSSACVNSSGCSCGGVCNYGVTSPNTSP